MLKPFYDYATLMIFILICSNALVMSSVFVLIHQTRLIVIEVFLVMHLVNLTYFN